MTQSSRSAWLRNLRRSRRSVFSVILLTGAIVSLVLTAPSATSYIDFSRASFSTSITITDVTWEADATNSSVTIRVSFLAANPSDAPIDLVGLAYNIRLNDRHILGGVSAGVVPPASLYSGHNVTVVGSSTATIQSTVNFILGQSSYLWYLEGTASLSTGLRGVSISFAQSFLG